MEGNDLDRFVNNYMLGSGDLTLIETVDNTDYKSRERLLDGGGALAGTAADYMRFASMLANSGKVGDQQFLSPGSVDRLFQPMVTTASLGTSTGFGLGFALGDAQSQAIDYMPEGTAGWAGSGNTFFWVYPNTGTAVVFMTQVIGAADVPFRRLLIEALQEEGIR